MTKFYMLFLFLILSGCNYSIDKNPAALATTGDQSIEKLPTGTIPGYQTINAEIIAPKCLGCHSSAGGNAGGINLETYANVSRYLSLISSAVTSGSMPRSIAPLTPTQKEVFLSWIDAGGPFDSPTPVVNSSDPTPLPTPTPPPRVTPTPSPIVVASTKIDYQLVNTNVIGPRCISCHSDGGGNRAGINLETYENVFNERNAIKNEISSGSMPPGTPLTSTQKQTILTWLNKGAPETVP